MGNTPTKGPSKGTKSSKLSRDSGPSTHAKSTTGVDFQKSLRKYQDDQSEYQYLSTITHFDENTLRLLYARFRVIDQAMEEDGYISLEEFAQILAMPSESLLLKRFFKFMDKSDMGTLNFRNFVDTMSKLSIDASLEDKVDLSFFLYDINQDGYIDRTECKQMVQAALEQIEMQLSEKQIDQIVQNTFDVTDTNNDNLIDKEEYAQYCKKNPRILQSFQVDISNLIQYEHEKKRNYHRYSNSMELKRTLHHGPNHSPNTDNKFFGIKIKKPKNKWKTKVERVKSIHDPEQIMPDGVDEDWEDDDNDNNSYNKSNTLKSSDNINDNDNDNDNDDIDPSTLFRKSKSADISKVQRNNNNNNNNNNGNIFGNEIETPTLTNNITTEDDSQSQGSSSEEKYEPSISNTETKDTKNNNNNNNHRNSNRRGLSIKKDKNGNRSIMRRSRSPDKEDNRKDKKKKKKSKSRGRNKSKSPSNSPENDTITRQKSENNSLSLQMPKSRKARSKPT